MELETPGGIGDELSATVAVRAYKKAYPDENIRIFESRRKELWLYNPHLNVGNRENGRRVRLDYEWRRRDVSTLGEQYCKQLGVPVGDPNPELFLTDEEKAAASLVDPRTVALAPAAKWYTREWKRDRYVALAEYLKATNRPIIEFDDKKPAKPLPFAQGIYGRPLREVSAILSRCALLVCGDTSPMHLAAAVGTKQVVIFGVVPARCRAFPTTYPLEGSPCYSACDDRKCRRPGGCCLDEVSVEKVIAAVEIVLAKKG
jgi:ADP-heptose:LPS heptosyltransferase